MNARTIHVYELGLSAYEDVHKLQRRLQAQRREGAGVDSLLLTEHEPVFTLGRSHPQPKYRAPLAAVEAAGIPVVQTERGGDITYHGPGQLVAYGIIDLKLWDISVLDYVTALEDCVIRLLGDWGLRGERVDGARGVWVAGRKVASLGLNVRRWVTMHGVAVNVEPNLQHFGLINPCGLQDVEMTSLTEEIGKRVQMDHVAESFVFHFGQVLGCVPELVDLQSRGERTGT
ncbi:MAG: lipoyl(octanoyl) transferase LipB [Dehalococcoidia bacterium]